MIYGTQRDDITENIYKLFYCNAMNMVLNYKHHFNQRQFAFQLKYSDSDFDSRIN